MDLFQHGMCGPAVERKRRSDGHHNRQIQGREGTSERPNPIDLIESNTFLSEIYPIL